MLGSTDHKWGSVSQDHTLIPGKEGAHTRCLVTWGMLPLGWVCGSKDTNLFEGVCHGRGHWPDVPCSLPGTGKPAMLVLTNEEFVLL